MNFKYHLILTFVWMVFSNLCWSQTIYPLQAFKKSPASDSVEGWPFVSFYPQNQSIEENIPLVIIIPGGGYAKVSFDKEGIQVAKFLQNKGIHALLLKYRHGKRHHFPQPLQDANEALDWVFDHAHKFHIDTMKIGVIGFSAGGHLAGMLSNLSSYHNDLGKSNIHKLSFSALIYPVIDMSMDKVCHSGSKRNLLGDSVSTETAFKFSLQNQVSSQTPPTFLVLSQDDKAVPEQNCLLYYESLRKFKIHSELHIFQNGGHGYGLGVTPESPKQWPEMFITWMKGLRLIP